MRYKKAYNEYLKEWMFIKKHPSGLEIIIYPMKDHAETYAIFGSCYGSIDNCFRIEGEKEFVTVPDGIAHFLEHKLFENEDGDAFERYAKTGASANAYTSFDKTCYLFSCTDNFEASLEILLDFVQSPYFTKQTVDKEQGIIGQEIRMYDDSPQWQANINLMKALYSSHSVRRDIAGTVESIAQITPEMLYRSYDVFYNLNNMVLCVAGNVTPEQVLTVADRMLKKSPKVRIERKYAMEKDSAYQEYIEAKLPVPTPVFTIGYKENADYRRNEKDMVKTDILMEVVAGRASPLYKRIIEEKLINGEFEYEYFEGPVYASIIFSGESDDLERLADVLDEEIDKIRRKGISDKAFKAAQRLVYGRYAGIFGNAEDVTNLLVDACFAGRDLFKYVDAAAQMQKSDIEKRLSIALRKEGRSISVVKN